MFAHDSINQSETDKNLPAKQIIFFQPNKAVGTPKVNIKSRCSNPRTPKLKMDMRLSPEQLADIQVAISPTSTKEVNLTMQTKSMKELSNQHTVSKTITQYQMETNINEVRSKYENESTMLLSKKKEKNNTQAETVA